MYYALYELALHPEIQNRLRAEIMQVLNKHNGELTYDGMQEMAYWTWLCQVRVLKHSTVNCVHQYANF
jgi:cytochrome P450 family 6